MGTAARRQRREAERAGAEQETSARRAMVRDRRRLGGGLAITAIAAVAIVALLVGPLGWRLPASGSAGQVAPSSGSGVASPTGAGSSSGGSGATSPVGSASGQVLEFEPIDLGGQGDGRVAFDVPSGAAALARVANRGSGAFHVQTVSTQGALDQVLVDTAGDYDGLLLFDALVGQHSVAFDVRSGGSWTIRIEPVGLAPSWSALVPLTGSGDSVALLDATADGTTGVRIQHLGQGPIVVLAYTAGGELDQVADVTGPLDETDVVPAGTICFAIRAVGRWTLSPG